MTTPKPPREAAAEEYVDNCDALPSCCSDILVKRMTAERRQAHLAGQRFAERRIVEWLMERQHLIPSRVMEEIKREFGE